MRSVVELWKKGIYFGKNVPIPLTAQRINMLICLKIHLELQRYTSYAFMIDSSKTEKQTNNFGKLLIFFISEKKLCWGRGPILSPNFTKV